MILIVCALAQELRHWAPRPHVEVLATGVGPVEAAIATSRAIAISPPAAIVSAGIAGGFRGRAAVGEAFAIATDVLAELGLEDGSPLPPLPGGAQLAERVESDPGLLEAAASAGLRIGSAVTVATITTSAARAADLEERFDADVEAMEGFAVLRSAAIAGLPAIELRGVSNLVGPRSASEWDFDAGARALGAALDHFLDVWGSGEI